MRIRKTALIVAMFVGAMIAFLPQVLRPVISDPPEGAPPVGAMRTLAISLAAYQAAYGNLPKLLAELGPPPAGSVAGEHSAGLINPLLVSGRNQGYRFAFQSSASRLGGPLDSYTLNADPDSGAYRMHLYSDERGGIHYMRGGPATAASPILK